MKNRHRHSIQIKLTACSLLSVFAFSSTTSALAAIPKKYDIRKQYNIRPLNLKPTTRADLFFKMYDHVAIRRLNTLEQLHFNNIDSRIAGDYQRKYEELVTKEEYYRRYSLRSGFENEYHTRAKKEELANWAAHRAYGSLLTQKTREYTQTPFTKKILASPYTKASLIATVIALKYSGSDPAYLTGLLPEEVPVGKFEPSDDLSMRMYYGTRDNQAIVTMERMFFGFNGSTIYDFDPSQQGLAFTIGRDIPHTGVYSDLTWIESEKAYTLGARRDLYRTYDKALIAKASEKVAPTYDEQRVAMDYSWNF